MHDSHAHHNNGAGTQVPASAGDRDTASPETTMRTDSLKDDLALRLRRIEGQVRGLNAMIEENVYCDKVLHQIAAVQAALNGVGKLVLEDHMRHCLIDRIQEGDHSIIDELLVTMKTLMR